MARKAAASWRQGRGDMIQQMPTAAGRLTAGVSPQTACSSSPQIREINPCSWTPSPPLRALIPPPHPPRLLPWLSREGREGWVTPRWVLQ